MNCARLLIGYPVYLCALPVLGFRQGNWRDRLGVVLELLATAALIVLACYAVPARWLLHGWLIPMLFMNTMVNIRGMSQHTLLEHSDDEIRGTRSILTTPLGRVFMLNENGDTWVIDDSSEYKLVRKNSLGDVAWATPAIARGSLFIRTFSSLFRIQNTK